MRDLWLIEQSAMFRLRSFGAARVSAQSVAEARASFASAAGASRRRRGEGPRSLSISGGVATIAIDGVLTPEPDFWLWMFGEPNTAYSDIQEAIAVANTDSSVTSIEYQISSPGGTVAGMFETIEHMKALQKPSSVRASLATSAAYGLAAAAGRITAAGRQSTFGSVGVAAAFRARDNLVEVTSSEAPNKRPDPRTDAGKAKIREYLDAVHSLFAEAIAVGRGTTVAAVNQGFGRGGLLLADEALKRGMIDTIAGTSAAGVGTSQASASAAPSLMDQALAILQARRAGGPKAEVTLLPSASSTPQSTSGKSLMDQGLDILEARQGKPIGARQ